MFEVVDEHGEWQPLDGPLRPLFLSGIVQPRVGESTKKTGRFVRSFGPVVQWVVHYETSHAMVSLHHLGAAVGRDPMCFPDRDSDE